VKALRQPELAAALGSLLLSAFVIWRTPIVNNDAVFYLAAAGAWLDGGFAEASRIFPLPLYPALVAITHRSLGLTLEASAHLLDSLLIAAASALLVRLVRTAVPDDPRAAWVAVVLVLAHPALNRLRAVLMRDGLYWCLVLVGVLLMLALVRRPRAWIAVAWAAVGLLAVPVRSEAPLVWSAMAAAPFAVPSMDVRVRRILVLVVACALLAAAAVLLLQPTLASGLRERLQVDSEYFLTAVEALAAAFPLGHGREYAPVVLVAGLSVIPPIKLVLAMGVPAALLAAWGLRETIRRPEGRIVALALVGTVAALYGFLPKYMFVETRYAIPASLFALVAAVLGWRRLEDVGERTRAVRLAAGLGVAATFTYSVLGGPPPPLHLREAGLWLAAHVPSTSRLHTNSLQIAMYSGLPLDLDAVQLVRFRGPSYLHRPPYDYYAVELKPGTEAELRALLERDHPGLSLLARITGARDEVVLIYATSRS
jgi:hypothetical protein